MLYVYENLRVFGFSFLCSCFVPVLAFGIVFILFSCTIAVLFSGFGFVWVELSCVASVVLFNVLNIDRWLFFCVVGMDWAVL